MKTPLTFLFLFPVLLDATAQTRSSADYAIVTETTDNGGRHSSSADYANDGSAGVVTGISNEATTSTIARHGFIGQLYELVGYGLLAEDYYPTELGTTQIITARTADDGTNFIIPPTGFNFSVLSGPLVSVSGTGLVTAGAVYENSEAVVRATSAAFGGQLRLSLYVQDTIPDNFGTYAGDGIGDDWQLLHFGSDNPLAAPLLDPDHDGQDNLFEFTAGLLPLDSTSRFLTEVGPVPGLPGRMSFVFSPRLADRVYTVKSSLTLPGTSWADLVNFTTTDDGTVRTITDLDATGAAKFYHVEITKP